MRAIYLNQGSGGQVLVPASSPDPVPGTFELLIRVHAAGLTPTELGWYPSSHTKSGQDRLRAIPCHEFSGTVVSAGDGVGSLEIGRDVYGMNDWFSEGALADYTIAEFS